jgi:hypothetical protein
MDISALKNQYETLYREVHQKADLLKKLDDSGADAFPEASGDLFVRDCQIEGDTSRVYSGRVAFNPSDGSLNTVDIEEKAADGSVVRYKLDREQGDTANQSVLVKKTDTVKLKATVLEKPSSPHMITLEEIQFVEAALAPEIDTKSEQVKGTVLEMAKIVESLDISESDSDKADNIIIVKNATATSPGGESISLAGKVVRDPSTGGYSTIELMGTMSDNRNIEFYFSRSNDFDYYKKADESATESTQIFEKGGPRLVLFTQEHRFMGTA